MKPISGNVLLLLILGACLAQTRALPMTNDDQELTSLDSVEHVEEPAKAHARAQESQFVGRIAPRNLAGSEERPEEQFDTFVTELQAAGVRTADRRDLHTLSYKELAQLLALYQLSQGRNYYEAEGHKEPPKPNQAIDH